MAENKSNLHGWGESDYNGWEEALIPVDEMEVWIEKVRNGDQQAFGKIYDQFHRMVASVLRKVGRCPSDEMDFHINEVFFRIYKGIFSFKGNSKFSTYVYRIALNYTFQLTKKLKKERQTRSDLDENMPDEKIRFEDKIVDRMTVNKVLDQLSVKLRTVVILFYYDMMSIKEIAEIEQISENAVKNRLFQAREKIRLYMEEL